MQTPTRMDKEVIEDFYHMITMDKCELDETNTSNLKISLNHWAPFCTFTYTWKFSIAFKIVHTRENEYLSFLYTMCTNASNNAPS